MDSNVAPLEALAPDEEPLVKVIFLQKEMAKQ